MWGRIRKPLTKTRTLDWEKNAYWSLCPASPAARSGVSGCVCGDASSPLSLCGPEEDCRRERRRREEREEQEEQEEEEAEETGPRGTACPGMSDLSGTQSETPSGGAQNKRLPSQ
ncbi:unnamed protein product [Knipowitschia caucasica]